MKIQPWKAIKAAKMTPDRRARLDGEVKRDLVDLELKELRELAGMTQTETAAAAAMTQSELSRFEGREDHLLSTLRRYVNALGGELEVVAVTGDRRLTLRSV